MRIIVDVMGGDNAPREILKGVWSSSLENPDVRYILVGDKEKIESEAYECGISLDAFAIEHTSEVITMEDDPLCVTRSKSGSSMSVGLRLLADGVGDAFVSAGNTGALFTGASLIVRCAQGVRRAAIGALLPSDPPVLLLDSGANVSVTPEYLEQFAVMGTAYMKKIHGVENPRVGLLNNGAEECKGTTLQVSAYKLLSSSEQINFVGNIEANSAMRGKCDVLVTDGFTGNILLKSIEGMGRLMLKTMRDLFSSNIKSKAAYALIRNEVGGIKKNFDSSEYGGAPILGIAKPVIKAHGSSKQKAFKNALAQAIFCAEREIARSISEDMKVLAAAKKAQKNAAEAAEEEN